MNNVFKAAMAEIRERIEKLHGVLKTLEEIAGENSEPVKADLDLPAAERVKRPYARKQAAAAPGREAGEGIKLKPMEPKGRVTLCDRMREVIAGWAVDRVFTRAEMEAAIRMVLPGLTERDASSMAVNLGNMTARGELTRKGYGRMAEYRRGKDLKVVNVKHHPSPKPGPVAEPATVPSAKEQEYRKLRETIQVPRDPDVETMS